MLIFFKKFSAGSAAATWLLSGVYVVGKGGVYWKFFEAKSLAQFTSMGGAAVVAIIPTVVQYQAFTKEFMGLAVDEVSGCKAIDIVCDNKASKLFTAILKAAFASGSLDMILQGMVGLPTAAAIILPTALSYTVSQFFVVSKSVENKSPETTLQKIKRNILMSGAALGGIMSAGMPLFGGVNIMYMIAQQTLNPSIRHSDQEVLKVDGMFLGIVTPAIIRHALMYAVRTHNKLQPKNLKDMSTLPKWLQVSDRYILIPYSSIVTSIGSLVGPFILLNLLLELVFDDRRVLDVFPISVVISFALITFFGLLQNIYTKYAYLYGGSYSPSEAADKQNFISSINDGVDEETALVVSSSQNYGSLKYSSSKQGSRPSFWQRIFCCSEKEEIREEQNNFQLNYSP